MISRVQALISPPTFEDEETNRVAQLLNTILWGMIVMETLRALLFFFLPDIMLSVSLAATAGIYLVAAGLLWMLHAGRVKSASLLLLIGLWIPLTVLMSLFGGIRGPIYMLYIEIITVAGLLLGGRGAGLAAGTSLAGGLAILLLERNGVIEPSTNILNPNIIFGTVSQVFVIVAMLITLYHRGFIREIRRSRQNERALAAANKELKAIRTSLEAQVVERTRRAERARARAEDANRALQAQVWQVTGLAELSDVMRGEQDVNTLAANILGHLAHYLAAEAGVLYLETHGKLKPVAMHDVHVEPQFAQDFDPGIGPLGQVARDRKAYRLKTKGHPLTVQTSFGNLILNDVILYPLIEETTLIGIVEVGRVAPFTTAEISFFEEAMERAAGALAVTITRTRVNALLEETQAQAEELQAQEEELRAANEELEAQAERHQAVQEAQSKEQQDG
jgi:hypothetical protein